MYDRIAWQWRVTKVLRLMLEIPEKIKGSPETAALELVRTLVRRLKDVNRLKMTEHRAVKWTIFDDAKDVVLLLRGRMQEERRQKRAICNKVVEKVAEGIRADDIGVVADAKKAPKNGAVEGLSLGNAIT